MSTGVGGGLKGYPNLENLKKGTPPKNLAGSRQKFLKLILSKFWGK
jgi:hypothetical protein